MAAILRIIDRFILTGRGTVYVAENCFHSDVRIGDRFFDLHGNRFEIKGIEMFRPFINSSSYTDDEALI